MSAPQPSGILRLPLELRFEIYQHLCRKEPLCYPFPNSPITSVDHRGPPRQLLLTSRSICSEVRTYYYGLTIFRFLALGSSRRERDEISAGSLAAIRNAKKVELMLVWNITPERADADPETWPWWMTGWLHDQVKLLLDEAHNLELVIISVRDASSQGTWGMKHRLLAPLELLRHKVRFEVGEVIAADDEEEVLQTKLQAHLKALNR